MKPGIAVITPNVLMGIGLRTILERLVPVAEISVFASFEAFEAEQPERFFHYFAAVSVFARHSAFFRARSHKTILLGGSRTQFAEMHRLDIFSSEERLVHDMIRMRQEVPRPEHTLPAATTPPTELSAREIEVLELVAAGLINKQIADRLGIGVTTVISHRRNLMEKLGIKTVAGLTLYAVTMGYVDAETL